MRKYNEYKDSGSNLIGKIPVNWEICRFGNVFRLKPVVPHHNEELLSVFLEYGVIPASESEKRTHKPSEDLSKYQLVEKTDFVMNNQQAWRGSVGVSQYVGIISPAYHIFKMPRQLNASYANYLLRDKCMVGHYEMSSKGVGSIQRTLNFNWLNNGILIIPPFSEQRIIASFLNNKSREIDNLISKTEREIELLKELKQSVVAHAVTKGLNPNAKMKDSGISWIGEIPEHWEVRKMKYTFKERSEKNHPTEPVLCATQSQGVIPQSMYENRVVVVNKGFENLKFVKKGDFVISLRSFQGGIEYAHYQGIISAAYTILFPVDALCGDYARVLLKSHNFIQLLKTCVTGIREGQNINYEVL